MSTETLVLLLAGTLAASTLSGTFGVGGGSLLLLLLTHALGPVVAVPVLTLTQLMANGSRAALGWRDLAWRPALWFIAGAVPGVAVGAWVLGELPADALARVAGGAILLGLGAKSVLGRDWKPRFWLVGAATGLLSAVAGIAGPFTAVAFWQLGLPPLAFIASEALAVTGVHLLKTLAYARIDLLGGQTLSWGLLLGGVSLAGSWLGRRLAGRIQARIFRRVVLAFLVVAALQLLIGGAR